MLKNARLVFDAARNRSAASPLLDHCVELYEAAATLGFGEEDMVAVVKAVAPDKRPGYGRSR